MNSHAISVYKQTLKLTKRQREIIVGTLLGDGHLETNDNGMTSRLVIEHSIKQKEYVEWKYHELQKMVRTPPQIKNSSFNGKQYQKYWFRTYSLGSFRFYYQQFYQDRTKRVPEFIHKWLTPLGLSVWFMDDGSIKSRYHRGRIINTQGFERKDVERLIQVLYDRFNIKAQLRKQREGYQIYLLSETIDKFVEVVQPYIIQSMEYKLKGLS